MKNGNHRLPFIIIAFFGQNIANVMFIIFCELFVNEGFVLYKLKLYTVNLTRYCIFASKG